MECPNRSMSGDATRQAGSEHMAMPNLLHPRPTVNVGWDEWSILLLVKGKEVGSNILSGLEQGVPAFEHSGNSSMPSIVS